MIQFDDFRLRMNFSDGLGWNHHQLHLNFILGTHRKQTKIPSPYPEMFVSWNASGGSLEVLMRQTFVRIVLTKNSDVSVFQNIARKNQPFFNVHLEP